MGGHSHWSQVKRQKGASDAKRGQLFTKLGREIMVAAREGGGDPEMNPRLRLALAKARDNNMPADTIERAIKRGTGQLEDAKQLIDATFEGYGPGGVAIMVDVLTDNRNRAVSALRTTFSRGGGSLGESGCVAWQFESKGLILIEASEGDPEEIALMAIDAGAEDVQIEDKRVEVHTAPENLERVRRTLEEMGMPLASAELSMLPKSTVSLDDKQAVQVLRLLDSLEELDDVQRVYSNGDFPDEVLVEYASRS
ncbi:MAG: YebC/PmpR family DNA-binding transcriptional regulator [Dehalococcoidia bacterium]